MLDKIIIFPTDTVYGIGASVYDKKSLDKIYDIKKRPKDKPLAVLCANLSQIDSISYVTEEAKKLINAFLPGPLTIILKSKENIRETMGIDTVGIRIPKYNIALDILTKYGPMATTSVNESGMPSLNNYSIIKEEYDDLVDDIFPPSEDPTSSLPSTVVSITDGVKILREGAITKEMIEKVLETE